MRRNDIEIYPKDYFERYKVDKKSDGGFSEHHCYGSWNDDKVPGYILIVSPVL